MIQLAQIHVRFSDLDVMGHVNNSIYLSYFEMARIHYFNQMLGTDWDWKKDGVLLVRNEVDYIKPVLLNDKPEIKLFTMKIGQKSFSLGYELSVDGEIYTTGASVLVSFNSIKGETIEIPAKLKESLELLMA